MTLQKSYCLSPPFRKEQRDYVQWWKEWSSNTRSKANHLLQEVLNKDRQILGVLRGRIVSDLFGLVGFSACLHIMRRKTRVQPHTMRNTATNHTPRQCKTRPQLERQDSCSQQRHGAQFTTKETKNMHTSWKQEAEGKQVLEQKTLKCLKALNSVGCW